MLPSLRMRAVMKGGHAQSIWKTAARLNVHLPRPYRGELIVGEN